MSISEISPPEFSFTEISILKGSLLKYDTFEVCSLEIGPIKYTIFKGNVVLEFSPFKYCKI